MTRRYLSVGSAHTFTQQQKDKLQIAIIELQWFDVKDNPHLPFMQGYALKEMIKSFGEKTDRVAHGIFGDFSLLAIRNNYSRGDVKRVTLYAIDLGDKVTNLAVDEETQQDLQTQTNKLCTSSEI